jgi:hypothetical protein
MRMYVTWIEQAGYDIFPIQYVLEAHFKRTAGASV